eukprot:3596801-Rhodomonas_salina.1
MRFKACHDLILGSAHTHTGTHRRFLVFDLTQPARERRAPQRLQEQAEIDDKKPPLQSNLHHPPKSNPGNRNCRTKCTRNA